MSESNIPPELLKQLEELQKRLSNVESDVKNVRNLSEIGKDVAEEILNDADALKNRGVFIPFVEKKAEKVRTQRLRVLRKRGLGARPLTKEEILDVQKVSKTALETSRKLGVDYRTYKKYAVMHGVHKTPGWPPKKGVNTSPHVRNPYKGKYPIDDILQNKFPFFPIHRLKDKLIRSGKKEAACEQCGFKERRVTDGKIPLLLAFNDSNSKNHSLENLKVLCYNCAFLTGRGYFRKGEKFFDPDTLQDSKKILPARH